MEGLNYGFWLTAGVTVAYLGVATHMCYSGKWALGLVFASYSVANIGFLMMMKS